MKKFLIILLSFLYLLSLIFLGAFIFLKKDYLLILFLVFLFIFLILFIFFIIKFKNIFAKEARKIYKNNFKTIKPILEKQLELFQLKTTIKIIRNDKNYYCVFNDENLLIKYDYLNIAYDRELLYYLFSKTIDKLYYSYSFKSLIHYVFSNSLLAKDKYKNIEYIDLIIIDENKTHSKFIKKRFGSIELSSSWRIN